MRKDACRKKGNLSWSAAVILLAALFCCVGGLSSHIVMADHDMDDADLFDYSLQEILEVEDDRGRLGDYGRLLIPEVDVNVALFYADDNLDGNAQAITDAEDSAVFMPWGEERYLIADHWTQGFLNIRDCRVGTAAYIKKKDRIEKYVCTEMTTGHNLETIFLIDTGETGDEAQDEPYIYEEHIPVGVVYNEAESETEIETEVQTEVFYGTPLEELEDFDLFMYTCNGRWQDIYIALFVLDEVYGG